jgi:hypothetical protein
LRTIWSLGLRTVILFFRESPDDFVRDFFNSFVYLILERGLSSIFEIEIGDHHGVNCVDREHEHLQPEPVDEHVVELRTEGVELIDSPNLSKSDGLVDEHNVETQYHPHGDSNAKVVPLASGRVLSLAGMGTEDQGERDQLQKVVGHQNED